MKNINHKEFFMKKLQIKYLRKYIEQQIKLLKKINSNFVQFGGEREGEQIRLIGISSFFQDAPNIVIRTINIYWRIDKILTQLQDIAETYDESGEIKQLLGILNNLTAALKIFVQLYGTIMTLFSGKWNEKVLESIKDFNNRMDETVTPDQQPDWKKFHTLLHEISDNLKKTHPELSQVSHTGGGTHNDTGESNNNEVEVTPQAAAEISALAVQGQRVLNEVVDRVETANTKVIPKVFAMHGNPFDKVNRAITNGIAAATDAAKAIPGIGAVVSGVSVLDKITKNADLILSMVETNLIVVEEILADNLNYDEKTQKWIVPIIEESKLFIDLAQNSPEVMRLIQAASNRITDDIIDQQIPPSDTYLSSEYWSRGIAKDLQRQLNKYIEKNIMPPDNWNEQHEEIHEQSQPQAVQGGRKKSKSYKNHRIKRTKNKTLKKKH